MYVKVVWLSICVQCKGMVMLVGCGGWNGRNRRESGILGVLAVKGLQCCGYVVMGISG